MKDTIIIILCNALLVGGIIYLMSDEGIDYGIEDPVYELNLK